MVKISRNSMALLRLKRLRRIVKVDTQKLRSKLIDQLTELFHIAASNARNKSLALKQRQAWTRVATYTVQVMNTVASGFDERQMNAYLDEAERLVNAAKAKGEAGEDQEETQGQKEASSTLGPG